MRVTIFSKILSSFLMIILLLSIVSFISFTDIRIVVDSFSHGTEHYRAIVTAATEASSYAKRAEGHLFMYLSLHNVDDKNRFFLRCDSLQRQFEILDKSVQDPHARTELVKMQLFANEIIPVGKSLIELHDREMTRTGQFRIEKYPELIKKLFDLTSKVRQATVELATTEVELESNIKQSAIKRSENLQTILIWLGLLSSTVVVLLSYFISRSISRPIIKLKTTFGEIGRGNFGVRANITSNDEIGILAGSINRMVEELQESQNQLHTKTQQLQENEIRYRTLFEEATDGIMHLSTDLKIVMVNESFAKMHGYSIEEMQKMSLQDLDTRETFPMASERIAQLMAGATLEFEVEHHHKDGHLIHLAVSTNLVSIGDKKFIQAFHRDITERKRSEEELAKLRKAIVNSGEAIFMTDRNGIFTFVNPGFTRIYGYAADEIIGKVTPRILKSGLVSADLHEKFWNALLNGIEVKGELKNKTKDGTILDVEGSASTIYDEQSNIIGFLGIQRDITERKQAEERLHNSERQYRILAESSPEMIYLVGTDGRLSYVNTRGASEFHATSKELLGKHITEIFPLTIAQRNLESIQTAINTKKTIKREVIQEFPSGNKWIDVQLIPVLDENGQVVSVLGLSNDITERKHAENVLEEATKEREKLVKELQFALDNIKTLQGLIPICGYCKKIRDDQGSWSQLEAYFNEHSEVTFSHGICPECTKKFWGDIKK